MFGQQRLKNKFTVVEHSIIARFLSENPTFDSFRVVKPEYPPKPGLTSGANHVQPHSRLRQRESTQNRKRYRVIGLSKTATVNTSNLKYYTHFRSGLVFLRPWTIKSSNSAVVWTKIWIESYPFLNNETAL